MSALNTKTQGKMYQVGDLTIDTKLREITFGSEVHSPQPVIFDTLIYLIENRDREISLDELKIKVWQDPNIEEFQLLRNILLTRRAVLDNTETQLIRYHSEDNSYRFYGDVFEVEFE